MTELQPILSVHAVTRYGRISVDHGDGRLTVRLVGEIDATFSDESFRSIAAAVRAAGGPVHVDCSAVTFFCAHGLRLLTLLARAAAGGRIASLVTSPAVDLCTAGFGLDALVQGTPQPRASLDVVTP